MVKGVDGWALVKSNSVNSREGRGCSGGGGGPLETHLHAAWFRLNGWWAIGSHLPDPHPVFKERMQRTNAIVSLLGWKVFPDCSMKKQAMNAELWLYTLKMPAVREGAHRRLEMKQDTKYFSTAVILPANSLVWCQAVYSQASIQCSSFLERSLQGQSTHFSLKLFIMKTKSYDSSSVIINIFAHLV